MEGDGRVQNYVGEVVVDALCSFHTRGNGEVDTQDGEDGVADDADSVRQNVVRGGVLANLVVLSSTTLISRPVAQNHLRDDGRSCRNNEGEQHHSQQAHANGLEIVLVHVQRNATRSLGLLGRQLTLLLLHLLVRVTDRLLLRLATRLLLLLVHRATRGREGRRAVLLRQQRHQIDVGSLELVVGSLIGDGVVLQHHNVVALVQILRGVGDQNTRATGHVLGNAFVEQRLSHVRVHSSNGVIHHHNIAVAVAATCQRDTCLLTSTHVDSSVSDLALVSSREHLQIVLQTTHLDDVVVLLLLVRLAEENVVAHRVVHQPRLLRGQRHGSVDDHHSAVLGHLAHQRGDEGGLAASHATHDRHQGSLGNADVDVVEAVLVVAPGEATVANDDGVLRGVVVGDFLLHAFRVLVLDDRSGGNVALHERRVHLGEVEEVGDTLDGDVELDEHHHAHGHHHEGHLENLEQRERRVGSRSLQRLAHHRRVESKGDERDDVGNEGRESLNTRSHDVSHLRVLLQLHVTNVVDLALEGLLPAVVLDHADSSEHLVHQLHTSVRRLQNGITHLTTKCNGDKLTEKHDDVEANGDPRQLAHLHHHKDDTDDHRDGNHDQNGDDHYELEKHIGIGGHDVHELTSGGASLGGRCEAKRLAVDGFLSNGSHLNSQLHHHHRHNRVEACVDGGDEEKNERIHPSHLHIYCNEEREMRTRILLLQIGNETIQDHGGNKAETSSNNVEKVGNNPSPCSRAAEHGSKETVFVLRELLLALPLLLVDGIQFLGILIL